MKEKSLQFYTCSDENYYECFGGPCDGDRLCRGCVDRDARNSVVRVAFPGGTALYALRGDRLDHQRSADANR